MTEPLRALLVQVHESDVTAILRELRREFPDLVHERVEDLDGFAAALGRRSWDVVIAERELPGFSSSEALQVLQTRGLDIPFVIVSRTISEEAAARAMREGAGDVLLQDNLSRLNAVVAREVREAGLRSAGRNAEVSRAESQRLFRAVFDGAIDMMLIFDDELRYVDVNPAVCEFFGLRYEQIVGRTAGSLGVIEADVRELLRRVLERGRLDGDISARRAGDGATRVLEFNARANIVPGRHVAVARDVTKQRRLQEQLLQAQKMEGIGALAGGIAHDFNNLLSVILSYTQFLQGELREGTPAHDDLREIEKAAERASQLTGQLLAFSRQSVPKLRVVSTNDLVQRMESMLRRVIGEDLVLTTKLSAAPCPVKVDPGQLEQVLLNLAVNARDAMPAGGELHISTGEVTLPDDAVALVDVAPGRYVLLSVHDTGTGIPANVLRRVFEPFFTTKPKGKGTGLGLAMVFGIIQQSGGYIVVDSIPGTGTAFHVYLPCSGEGAEAPPSEEPRRGMRRGDETILLVEDDEQVRALTASILRRQGYTVIEAESAMQALERCAETEPTIDLLLTDVVMPQMNGRELAEQLQARRPGLVVIYMSGYTDNVIAAHGASYEGLHFLAKPITPDVLCAKIRAVLDGC